MSDKIQKVEREIVAGSSAALERALEDESLARRGESRPHRWPKPGTPCGTCGHTYALHNYSDSLDNLGNDPLGFMYQCNGNGLMVCACKKFELPPFFTSDGACLNDSFGVHKCPGYKLAAAAVSGFASNLVFCECTCSNCLTATRRDMMRVVGDAPSNTDEDVCIGLDHKKCPVELSWLSPPRLIVCRCDCINCMRLWHAAGRPIARNGKIIRMRVE